MTGHDNSHASPNSATASTTTGTLFNRAKLYELVNSVAYGERLDPPVEYVLNYYAAFTWTDVLIHPSPPPLSLPPFPRPSSR